MELYEVEFGRTCSYVTTKNGTEQVKKAVITGPWDETYPDYVGIRDLHEKHFCYIEASRLFYPDEPKRKAPSLKRKRIVSVPPIPASFSSGVLRASIPWNTSPRRSVQHEKIRIM